MGYVAKLLRDQVKLNNWSSMICLKKLLLLPVFRINTFILNLIILLFKFLTYIK